MFTRLPYTSHITPVTPTKDTGVVSLVGPSMAGGPANSSGFDGKTCQAGQSHPKRPERGTKRHKGWPAAGASGAPLREGAGILKLHI
jgi:hypothetical protein